MGDTDLFSDIRKHAGAPGGKFLHENVVLAAVEEILSQQSLDRSAVSYMGALMLSLQSEAGAEPAIYAGVLKLLERTLGPSTSSMSYSPGALSCPQSAAFSAPRAGLARLSLFHHERAPL